jgi:hypothetical protein
LHDEKVARIFHYGVESSETELSFDTVTDNTKDGKQVIRSNTPTLVKLPRKLSCGPMAA